MQKISIDPGKIGAVIGTGGKTIRSIIEETKASIDVNDDGTVIIGSTDAEATRRAIEIIESLTKEAEVGATYTGKVTRIFDFGAMVEILPGKEGLETTIELRGMGHDFPIVAMTASSSKESENKARSVGMNEYLIKPVNVESIKDILIRWFAEKK